MIEKGTVISLDNEIAEVLLEGEKDEDKCRKCGACLFRKEGMVLRAKRSTEVSIGDRVTVELSEIIGWKGIIYVYLLPIVALIIGIVAGSIIFAMVIPVGNFAQLIAFFIGIVFFVVALLVGKFINNRLTTSGQCTAIIIEITEKAESGYPRENNKT